MRIREGDPLEIFTDREGEATIDGDVEFRLIQTAAAFLARQLQEFNF